VIHDSCQGCTYHDERVLPVYIKGLLNKWTVALQLQCRYVSLSKKMEKNITSSLTSLS